MAARPRGLSLPLWLVLWTAASVALLGAAACSSSGSFGGTSAAAPPAQAAATQVSGSVVDDNVINATVTAYEVSAAGVVGNCVPASPGPCATATTNSSGSYSVNLGSYTGPVLLEATGGSYTDTVTGKTLPIPSSLTLSSFVPSVTPGSTTVTAQITGLTTIAANLALAQMAPPQNAPADTAASNANVQVQSWFGIEDVGTTALLNLADPGCSSSAATSQASFDVSLILAGIAQLASQYGVSTAALTQALIQDFSSNGGVPTGLYAGSGQITIAGTTISLATIEGSSFAQSLEAAIQTFVASTANACKAAQSSTEQQALQQHVVAAQPNCAQAYYCYSVPVDYSGPGNVVLEITVTAGCPDDSPVGTQFQGRLQVSSSSGTVSNDSVAIAATAGKPTGNDEGVTYDYVNDCGTNFAFVTLAPSQPQPVSCNVPAAYPDSSGNSPKVTFTSADGGYHNSSSTFTVTCTAAPPATYTVGGTVSGLPSGASVTIADTINGDSVVATANGSFTLPAQLGAGTQYAVTATPSSSSVSCTVTPSGTQTIEGNVTNVAVSCTGGGGGGSGTGGSLPVALNGPNAVLFMAPNFVFVANAGGANGGQVLVYTEQLDSSTNTVTGLTEVASIVQGINQPTRLAIDSNQLLYVTNTGNNTVTVYNVSNSANITANTIPQVTQDTISSGLDRPLGIAVDGQGYVYVANNSANSISIYQPGGSGFVEVGSALTQDASGNAFSAPGVLAYYAVPGVGNYVLVGLGPSVGADLVLLYAAPLNASSKPIYTLSNSGCSTGPSGPTAIALSTSTGPYLYIASYYSNNIEAFDVTSFLQTSGSCPAPAFGTTQASGIDYPEGVTVDAFDNVFVSNASSNTVTVYSSGSGLEAAPAYTQH